MFIIQKYQSSICLTELMIVLLAFTLVDSNTSNEMICENSNTRDIHYFKVSSNEFNWTEAWSLCNNSGYTLPIICNQRKQDDLTNFLKATVGSSAVWTAGKRISFDEWKWIDGQPFNNRRVIQAYHESYTHVALKEDRSYAAGNPTNINYYLCQYPDPSCNEENEISLTRGCVRRSDEDETWYEARNRCLEIGGDLAKLSDADLDTLYRSNKLNAARSYWIGLRKNAWDWKRQITASLHNSDEEIKYSNWASDHRSLSGECISVDTSNGGWKSNSCTEKKTVVCQTRSGGTASSTSTSTMSSNKSSNTRSTMSTTIPNTTARSVSSMSESVTQSTESVDCQVLQAALMACIARDSSSLVMAVVIGGLCCIVITNIVVALGVRRYYLRGAKATSNRAETETKHYHDLETTHRQANPDGAYTELKLQPVYEEVSQRGH